MIDNAGSLLTKSSAALSSHKHMEIESGCSVKGVRPLITESNRCKCQNSSSPSRRFVTPEARVNNFERRCQERAPGTNHFLPRAHARKIDPTSRIFDGDFNNLFFVSRSLRGSSTRRTLDGVGPESVKCVIDFI